jgi:hypothetical protein
VLGLLRIVLASGWHLKISWHSEWHQKFLSVTFGLARFRNITILGGNAMNGPGGVANKKNAGVSSCSLSSLIRTSLPGFHHTASSYLSLLPTVVAHLVRIEHYDLDPIMEPEIQG